MSDADFGGFVGSEDQQSVQNLLAAFRSGDDRAAFFGLAGQIMRRLLMQHARPLAFRAEKVMLFEEAKLQAESGTMEVEHMLAGLAAVKPELRAVVEMKVFEGLTAEEIAGRLGCATVTVNRYWRFARHWLRTSLGADPTWQNKTPI